MSNSAPNILDLFRLDGKTALITGAATGLGAAIATALSQAGATVAVHGNRRPATETQDAIQSAGGRAHAFQADLSSPTGAEQLFTEAKAALGHVDILINAAGVNSGTPFFEITEQEWQRIIDIDLKSVFLACQVFGKAMVDAGKGGSIVNISSASSGPPLSKVFTYAVAKGGVNQITQFLAREFAPNNIRVNAILPGFFPAAQNRKLLTDERVASIMTHTPMHRFGESCELVGAVVYLCAPRAASFVTGSILPVDGGFLAMTI